MKYNIYEKDKESGYFENLVMEMENEEVLFEIELRLGPYDFSHKGEKASLVMMDWFKIEEDRSEIFCIYGHRKGWNTKTKIITSIDKIKGKKGILKSIKEFLGKVKERVAKYEEEVKSHADKEGLRKDMLKEIFGMCKYQWFFLYGENEIYCGDCPLCDKELCERECEWCECDIECEECRILIEKYFGCS